MWSVCNSEKNCVVPPPHYRKYICVLAILIQRVTIMRRDIEKELISWKSQKGRYPLIVRGARQVGKSYLVEAFGKTHFQNNVVVNFEFQPQLKDCFQSFDPSEIVNKLQLIQTALLQTYRSDFGKYAKISQHKYLQKVFDSAPRLVGQRIKYSSIDADTRSRDLKNALNLLVLAGIIKPIYLTKASGLPLGAQINEQKFKLNFLDVGLMQNSCGLPGRLSVEEDFMQINAGAVAEQFVGQELAAYSDKHQQASLYFWVREKKGSMAEVDYVINIGSDIFPVEGKSGKEGRLKSLRMFIEEKKARLGIRISQDKLSYYDKILSIPLYMIKQMPRIVKSSFGN